MPRPRYRPIRIVVNQYQLRPPHRPCRRRRAQRQIDDRHQLLRPALNRAQRRRAPVVCPDQLRHLPLAQNAVRAPPRRLSLLPSRAPVRRPRRRLLPSSLVGFLRRHHQSISPLNLPCTVIYAVAAQGFFKRPLQRTLARLLRKPAPGKDGVLVLPSAPSAPSDPPHPPPS